MYAGIITLTIVGLLVNYGLVWLERRATRWRGNAEDGGSCPLARAPAAARPPPAVGTATG